MPSQRRIVIPVTGLLGQHEKHGAEGGSARDDLVLDKVNDLTPKHLEGAVNVASGITIQSIGQCAQLMNTRLVQALTCAGTYI